MSSKTGSDTFRNVLIYGKEHESRKKNFITVQKNSQSRTGSQMKIMQYYLC